MPQTLEKPRINRDDTRDPNLVHILEVDPRGKPVGDGHTYLCGLHDPDPTPVPDDVEPDCVVCVAEAERRGIG